MGLYKLFSYNVEIQYKSYLLSKATLFTLSIGFMNIILPFIVAYKGKGFWLQSYHFYEQPMIRSTYDYLLIAETDDPSVNIICGEAVALNNEVIEHEEYCMETQILEQDFNKEGRNDVLEFKFYIVIPKDRIITSIILILGIDFYITNTCPLQMQSLAVINKEFGIPSNGFKYYGELQIHQSLHLPCLRNILDTSHNNSLFTLTSDTNKNIIDFILEEYLKRDVITTVSPLFSRNHNGHTGTMDINVILKIPEMKIRYRPSLLEELKWAWPQYLSLLYIFYVIFERIKRFVFSNRLLLAWEIVPWRRKE